MSAFFSMGGYAAFVWPCYLLTAVAMAWIGYTSWKRPKEAPKYSSHSAIRISDTNRPGTAAATTAAGTLDGRGVLSRQNALRQLNLAASLA